MKRRDIAENYFDQGYNCSIALVKTFADVVDTDEETLLKIAGPFGGGMGRLREVCGAVSGMLIILGLLQGYDTPETGEKKAELYKRVQKLALDFEQKNSSIVCRELLNLPQGHSTPEPTPRTENFYRERPCRRLIGDAAEILEDYLISNNLITKQ